MTDCVRVALGDERYGVAVAHVREVAEQGELVTVPGAGPHIAGLCHLHGELLPVVRLDRLLGAPTGPRRRIVVVEDGARRAGLAVDAAEEVEALPEPDAPGEPLTRGSVLHEGRLIGVLDVPALLDAVTASVT
ncbi:MAG: CheW protein [Conexibacter sp.]|nr:CheW protein [Conexibacter sp.]